MARAASKPPAISTPAQPSQRGNARVRMVTTPVDRLRLASITQALANAKLPWSNSSRAICGSSPSSFLNTARAQPLPALTVATTIRPEASATSESQAGSPSPRRKALHKLPRNHRKTISERAERYSPSAKSWLFLALKNATIVCAGASKGGSAPPTWISACEPICSTTKTIPPAAPICSKRELLITYLFSFYALRSTLSLILRLDDQGALHAGFTVTGDAAVEGVLSGRGRREQPERELARRHRDVDIQFVDVKAMRTGVAVIEPQRDRLTDPGA